jgi:hypothetical protein
MITRDVQIRREPMLKVQQIRNQVKMSPNGDSLTAWDYCKGRNSSRESRRRKARWTKGSIVQFAVFVTSEKFLDEATYFARSGRVEILAGLDEAIAQVLVQSQDELRVLLLFLFVCHVRWQLPRR